MTGRLEGKVALITARPPGWVGWPRNGSQPRARAW